MNANIYWLAVCCGAFIASTATADLPLTVEDLITDRGELKLDMALAYANSDRQGVQTGEPILVQTGPAAFITLPTRVGETRANTDAVVASLGLRYGMTRDAELYGRASYLHSATRASDLTGITASSDSGFSEAWLGLNYQFLQEGDTPALLGFVEGALREKQRESRASVKSWMV